MPARPPACPSAVTRDFRRPSKAAENSDRKLVPDRWQSQRQSRRRPACRWVPMKPYTELPPRILASIAIDDAAARSRPRWTCRTLVKSLQHGLPTFRAFGRAQRQKVSRYACLPADRGGFNCAQRPQLRRGQPFTPSHCALKAVSDPRKALVAPRNHISPAQG